MADTLVLQNAIIFDSTGRDPYGPGTVVVSGDRITAAGPADQVAVPRDATVIDAGNHTVMPGLIDAHTHVGAVDKENDIYLVPTLTVFELIAERGREQGISELTIEKINFARGAGRQSVEIAMAAGVNIAPEADLFGQNYGLKAVELELKADIMGSIASLVSATRTNAELLERSDEIGTLEPGKLADLIMVRGNPVEDIAILQDADNIPLVMQAGRVVK